jgi:hypothetical protein
MKKLSLKLTGIREALKKEEMKQVKGGGAQYVCYDECAGGACGVGRCIQVTCLGGTPYGNCF